MQRDLIIRARNGDHEAFSLLTEASFDQLLGTARLILRRRPSRAPQTAVQDALLLSWLHAGGARSQMASTRLVPSVAS